MQAGDWSLARPLNDISTPRLSLRLCLCDSLSLSVCVCLGLSLSVLSAGAAAASPSSVSLPRPDQTSRSSIHPTLPRSGIMKETRKSVAKEQKRHGEPIRVLPTCSRQDEPDKCICKRVPLSCQHLARYACLCAGCDALALGNCGNKSIRSNRPRSSSDDPNVACQISHPLQNQTKLVIALSRSARCRRNVVV